MQDLKAKILELIRLTSTDLPPDVEAALQQAVQQEEPGSAARGALETILKNIDLSRRTPPPFARTPAPLSSTCITLPAGAHASFANKSKLP
jgi:fumarate hydratase, class I